MGLESRIRRPSERSSARLLTRHLTLSLGHTPTPETIRAHQICRANSILSSYKHRQQPLIHHDINLGRVESSSTNPDLADEARFESIEDNVTGLKTDVTGLKTDVTDVKADVSTLKTHVTSINDKMDALITAMNKMNADQPPRPPAHPTPVERPPHASSDSNLDHLDTSGHAVHSRPDMDNRALHHGESTPHVGHYHSKNAHPASYNPAEMFVHREMDRDRFSYPEAGKAPPALEHVTSRSISKPYMFLYRDGVSTMKQKLDARHTVC